MAEVEKKKTTTAKKFRWELYAGAVGASFHACSNCGEVKPEVNERGTRCSHKFCPNCGKAMED